MVREDQLDHDRVGCNDVHFSNNDVFRCIFVEPLIIGITSTVVVVTLKNGGNVYLQAQPTFHFVELLNAAKLQLGVTRTLFEA